MLRNWKWPHWSRRKAHPVAFSTAGEEASMEILPGAVASGGWETVTLLVEREPATTISLEVDEGLTVAVLLNEQNAGSVLETTQRMREYREREKSSIPPVYNFGTDSHGPGGGD